MTPFRSLLMLTALLTCAAVGNAQTPSHEAQPAPFPLPKSLHPLDAAAQQPTSDCPLMNRQCWYGSVLDQTISTWQRMRMLVSTRMRNVGYCEGASARAAGCAIGIAGSVKSVEVAQAPKACACVKACGCCESCKSSKKESTAGAQVVPTPMTQEMMQRIAALRGIVQWQAPQPAPFPMVSVPPMHGTGVVQVMPVPNVRVVEVVQVVVHVRPVHLVTPDLDAHCERMTHRGDMVVLEGNVLLLCKKHAQPLRIDAQRVVVNMKDGSFTVESGSVTNFGVQRTSAVRPCRCRFCSEPITGCTVEPTRVMPTGGTNATCPASSGCEDLFRLLMKYCR